MSIDELYDDSENLLWKNESFSTMYGEEHDIHNDWPLVHGKGSVYDTSGNKIYTASFVHGKLVHIHQVIQRLPIVQVALNGQEDYIVCTPFKRNQIGICINDPEHKSIMSLKSFVTMMKNQILRDPLRGSYPGMRITKIKFI